MIVTLLIDLEQRRSHVTHLHLVTPNSNLLQ